MNVIIITGGFVDATFAKAYLEAESFDMVIAADRGVETAKLLNIPIDYILGDFDSLEPSILVEIKNQLANDDSGLILKEFPPEKDYTDTHLAIVTAIESGATKVTILGATGTRLDHVMANVNLLSLCLNHGIEARIVDVHNQIYVIDADKHLKKDKIHGKYVSLIPYTDCVTGVTLIGFKYPLYDMTMTKGNSLGISNELLEEEGVIKLDKGILIVIESRD
ncbi:thiamine pyrophosphokinase [Anaerosporobacter mobilis DSM 15930]|jgi:thiamine pyrophosphokinase|uniref:Thiamine diphosphokinase n=1 Tax=Anaerosporobacter mobilis DSM 15930 TaxID=1120996 RepID=A0A1M7F0E0_9FIRM|nr:thiamine diphosphokinase [Anaerosporobacter mobilis]SHL97159.1 thiamine pyrophosphokinase [Anaerosporobacter mobilis DSM 15930]